MNPHSYVHLVFYKVTKNTWWGKRQPLQQMLQRKVVIHLQKPEIRSMFINLY
jgi:hypothetical protein